MGQIKRLLPNDQYNALIQATTASASNPFITNLAHQALADSISNVDNTSDLDKPVSTAQQTALDLKVDKVAGKELSANDFTDADKLKLDNVEDGADVNNISDVDAATLTDGISSDANSLHTHGGLELAHTHTNKLELDKVTDGAHDVRTDDPHDTKAAQVDVVDADDNFTGTVVETILAEIGKTRQVSGFDLQAPLTIPDFSIVNATRTVTVAPKFGQAQFSYWSTNKFYTKLAAENIVLTADEGEHFVYYDGATLISTTTFTADIILRHTLVCIVYWDAENNVSRIFNETHGYRLNPLTHYLLHTYEHSRYDSGMQPSSITADASGDIPENAQFVVSAGLMSDEDLPNIVNATTLNGADKDVYYFDGSNRVRWFANRIYPVVTHDGTVNSRIAYNPIGGGRLEVPNNDFVLCHVIALNNGKYGFFTGQAIYGNINDARAGILVEAADLNYGQLANLTPEFIVVASFIYQASDSYANDVQARIRTLGDGSLFYDWRTTTISGTGGIAVNRHDLLTELNTALYSHPTAVQLATLLATTTIADGGTGATTAQDAVNALTNVAAGALGDVLTKDATGNAIFATPTLHPLAESLSTGYIEGLDLTVNGGDLATFDIAAGTYAISDTTDPVNIITQKLIYAGGTAIVPTYLASANVSYIGIDTAGVIIQKSSPFTNIERRSVCSIGAVIHSNRVIINLTNEILAPILSDTNQLHDFMKAIGVLNINGNEFSESGANLNIDKSLGSIFGLGINGNDQTDPHSLDLIALTSLTFRYRDQDGDEGVDTTNIDPNTYDVAGTLTAVANNKFTVQRISVFQSNTVRLQYGQTEFADIAEAKSFLLTQAFTTEQNIAENAIFRAYLILKQGVTDLAAGIINGDVEFIGVDKFGNTIGGVGTDVDTSTYYKITGGIITGDVHVEATPVVGGIASELFFSEYNENAATKYVEIYNGTGAPVDLSNYDIRLAFNTSPWSTTIPLLGILADGDTYLVADNGSNSAIVSIADLLPAGLSFNGNDAIGLFKNTSTLIDIIGIEADGVVYGEDKTYIRKATITDPNPIWLDWSEWVDTGIDGVGPWTYAGTHVMAAVGTTGGNLDVDEEITIAGVELLNTLSGNLFKELDTTQQSLAAGYTTFAGAMTAFNLEKIEKNPAGVQTNNLTMLGAFDTKVKITVIGSIEAVVNNALAKIDYGIFKNGSGIVNSFNTIVAENNVKTIACECITTLTQDDAITVAGYQLSGDLTNIITPNLLITITKI